MFILIRKPLITESELTSLKHKLDNEKQMVLEIYKIAFENFLRRKFTSKFLINEIRKQMNNGFNYLAIKLVNRDIIGYRSSFNFRYMIGETFSNSFWWLFFNRIVIKRKYWKYRKVVKKIAEPFKEDEIIQLSMEEIAEEVIYKSAVFQKVIKDLEESSIRVGGGVHSRPEEKAFILLLKWGEGNETNEE
ncbi:hypothetical protein SIM20_23945 [Bacillus cereus group sp. BfR-BA-02570]|uniref:hypothetical protein n=1 Tax=Bacillus cereus group sp. BfR-BA-02570 TaxID=3094890 RepID=UPI0029C3BA46|nr:hypothetical protein [Bacillus cereus group sp. BfR-BA-02570]MDX5746186.1 hypothetical protein [Bacillus cereus group sp. BfR-BA-02570]